jgi:hypothetical protein
MRSPRSLSEKIRLVNLVIGFPLLIGVAIDAALDRRWLNVLWFGGLAAFVLLVGAVTVADLAGRPLLSGQGRRREPRGTPPASPSVPGRRQPRVR